MGCFGSGVEGENEVEGKTTMLRSKSSSRRAEQSRKERRSRGEVDDGRKQRLGRLRSVDEWMEMDKLQCEWRGRWPERERERGEEDC